MLDGSENAVTGLLAHLFATEGVEMPHPEHEEPQRSPLMAPAVQQKEEHGAEHNEQVLAALAAFNAAASSKDKAAMDKAFAELLSTAGEGGETPKHALSKALGKIVNDFKTSGGFTHQDSQDVEQQTLLYIFSSIARVYDPAKARLNGWVTNVAKTQARMHLRSKGRRRETGTGDDTALDIEMGRHSTVQHGHSWAFDADEAKLCDALAAHLKKMLAGQEPFPIPVQVPGGDALPKEEKKKKRLVIEKAHLMAFMNHFGLGAPKKPHTEISQDLVAVGLPPASKETQGQWHKTLWPKLAVWAILNDAEIGLKSTPDEPNKAEHVFASFKNKLSGTIRSSGTHGSPTCAEDDDLSGLLTALEGWHEASNR